jgi:gluconate 2-dehydrogenase gamma chain
MVAVPMRLSRRSMLQGTAAVGAATALSSRAFAQAAAAGEPYTNLTPDEGRTLEAIVSRLIPSDANGPGALEAGAVHYIDRALGTALATSHSSYRAGLAALDARARETTGDSFPALDAMAQDALLAAIEQDTAALPGDITEIPLSPANFFALVREHTIEGTFCDPYYGGNQDFAGWSLVAYPGVRLAVTAADQAMDAKPAPSGISAYDLPMFDEPDDAA